jgi:NAD(P)-dependent dehydrogenase (short-subunit alcohol dehydrogenase family)
MTWDLELANRRVLVTAGTKGIGGAVATLFHSLGAKVIATARTQPSSTADEDFVAADLTTAEGCEKVVERVKARWGGVDIMVHVLGGSSAPAGGFAALSDAEWQKEINLNLFPAVRLGPCVAAIDVVAVLGSDCACGVDSEPASVAGIDYGIRRREGRARDVQQEPVEGSNSEGRARGLRFTGMGGDRGRGGFGRKTGQSCGHRLRGRQADRNEVAGRYSAGTTCEADRSREPHRVSGIPAGSIDHGHRDCHRRRNDSFRLGTSKTLECGSAPAHVPNSRFVVRAAVRSRTNWCNTSDRLRNQYTAG